MIKAFIDTNVFVYSIHYPESNSYSIIEQISEKGVEAIVSELVLQEVETVLSRTVDTETALRAVRSIRRNCQIIHREDVKQTMELWRGQIKEKDLENLAVVKQFHVPYLVSFDRDYSTFPEYQTPKQFVQTMGMKPFETVY